jgi:hypothetical protein
VWAKITRPCGRCDKKEDPGVEEAGEQRADVGAGQPIQATEMPGDQRRAADDQRQRDEQARRYAVDDDDGSWLIFELHAAEREEHPAREQTTRGDLDTKRRSALPGNQQQDARHQRYDEEHERLTGTATVRLGRREPRAIDRYGDEQQAGQRGGAADNGYPVVAPSLDVEGHRSAHSDMGVRRAHSIARRVDLQPRHRHRLGPSAVRADRLPAARRRF